MRTGALLAGFLLLVFLFCIGLYTSYSNSLYAIAHNRSYIGIWLGDVAYVLIIGQHSGPHYILTYGAGRDVVIPGGLQNYKNGALGKISKLTKDDNLFRKALSQMSLLPLHRAAYLDTNDVYYDSKLISNDIKQVAESIKTKIWNLKNLSLLDKWYIYRSLSQLRNSNTDLYIKNKPDQAALYDRTMRNEKKLVQIVYPESYDTASFISQLLEGIGVRVSDIGSIGNDNIIKRCKVIESSTDKMSETAIFIKNYFSCEYEKGRTGLYEIQFQIGREVIEEWRIR
jgi:hypothetical protein